MMAEVLIVGAGPTGLTLACELAWRGVGVRVIDRKREPSRYSKAIGVFPRTLELLENHGVADEMVREGVRVRGIKLHSGSRRLVRIDTGRIGSRYGYVLTIEQSVTERILLKRLADLGGEVERGVELVGLRQESDAVRVALERASDQADAGRETASVPWVVGCDGARSFVREAAGVSFEGERYQEAFDLADVELRWDLPGAHDHINVFLSTSGVLFAAPLPGGKQRLIADEPPGSADDESTDPTLGEFRRWWRERVRYQPAREAELANPGWLSRFTIQRRVVPKAREGRVLLAGDAMHVHSPAGAQGMNGGIQDAINLGWKLALVMRGHASEALLDTYDEERLPVARKVLKATHLGTTVLTTRNPVLGALRDGVASVVMRSGAVQGRAVNAAAELRVNYRGSSIVSGESRNSLAGMLRAVVGSSDAPSAGDRAPDVALAGRDAGCLYDVLRHPGHTLLAFAGEKPSVETLRRLAEIVDGIADGSYGDLVRGHAVVAGTDPTPEQIGAGVLIRDPVGAAHARYGMREAGLCLIRPDRYVALRTRTLDAEGLHRCLRMVFSYEHQAKAGVR
jgi:2-polyprenyl-6-methoxyphenol hydroxylase-like FAD-dependent oxidoreductase